MELLGFGVIDGMAQPVVIISFIEVIPCMGTAAFFTTFSADGSCFGNLEQIVKFQRSSLAVLNLSLIHI